jgi:hypothetical protein
MSTTIVNSWPKLKTVSNSNFRSTIKSIKAAIPIIYQDLFRKDKMVSRRQRELKTKRRCKMAGD